MGNLQIVIAALFVSAAGLNALANWLKVPYPIPLVIGGLVLGLVPGIPDIELDPELVLLVFLPPLLYASAFFADLRSLRADARVISLSAIGLVLATARGGRGHRARADRAAMGDVVRPRRDRLTHRPCGGDGDHAAGRRAAADGQRARGREPVQRRHRAGRLQGGGCGRDRRERLGQHTVLEFFGDVAGGIAIGLAVGWAIAEVRKRVTDVNTELTISLFSAYGAFIPADQLGVSGVLAVVTAGVYLGFRAPEIASLESRMQGYALWSILTFLLNATLFILIGLQLPAIVDGLSGRPAGEVIGYAAAVCAAVIAVRFLWNFIVTFLIRAIDRRPSQLARRAELAHPGRRELGRDARRGFAGGGAGAAAPHRCRRAAARTRADPVHHLRVDPRHRGGGGADAALADPPPRRGGGRHRGGERGDPRAAGDRPRRARAG